MKVIDLTGQRFERLTVVERIGSRSGNSLWLCRCDCGNLTKVVSPNLKNGSVKSCGCFRRQNLHKITHGMRKSPEYAAWLGMKARCYNPNNPSYANYGGRGIAVCEKWKNSFEAFFADMGKKPEKGFSIERIDVNKGYYPENCKWIPVAEQAGNRRNNKWFMAVSPVGEKHYTKNRAKFARDNGLNKGEIWRVLTGKASHHKGWTFSYLDVSAHE